jgi:hypothetical protein
MAPACSRARSVCRVARAEREDFRAAIAVTGLEPARPDRWVARNGRVDVDILQRRKVNVIPIRSARQLGPSLASGSSVNGTPRAMDTALSATKTCLVIGARLDIVAY